MDASHSFIIPLSHTLEKQNSCLPTARDNLIDPQLAGRFDSLKCCMVARAVRVVLDTGPLLDDGSWVEPEMTRKSHVAREPSVPALTISDSDRLPNSKSDTGER